MQCKSQPTMKTLKDLTKTCIKNSPEFFEYLQTDIIDPIEKLGATFLGLSSSGKFDFPETGVHILIFNLNDEGEKNQDQILALAEYNDEGTNSTNYLWFGTLFILIPMPF